MSLKLQSSGGGSVTIADPASTASNFTLNPPLRSGQLAVDGPAFSGYMSGSNLSVTSNVFTKVPINATEFDTASCFNTSTYRFTPNVPGYYQIVVNADMAANSGTLTGAVLRIYKNGTTAKYSSVPYAGFTGTEVYLNMSALLYANGSTDYFEFYVQIAGTSPVLYSGQTQTFFQAVLVRGA